MTPEHAEIKNVPRYSRIEIRKQALNFSVGHFTIFSEKERENLHGHNFQVECEITAPVGEDGLVFDYGIIKKVLRELCDELDEHVILPSKSPHLRLEKQGEYTAAIFNNERLLFLEKDLIILPIANTTVEEFSYYFLNLLTNRSELSGKGIIEVTVKVSSSPGQSGCSTWKLA